MNNQWIQYGIYFVLVVLLQGLVVNHIGISTYSYPMIYILPLLVLPFEINFFISLGLAFVLGISVDMLSDTFGLHTSASLWVAYIRPFVLNTLKPRDGYETALQPTVHDMGFTWYFAYTVIIIVIHHTWFFVLEVFRFDLLGLILLKILFSTILSLAIITGLQFLLYKPSK